MRGWGGILARCAEQGVTPVKTFPEEPKGRFAHILDPEGLKVELRGPKEGSGCAHQSASLLAENVDHDSSNGRD